MLSDSKLESWKLEMLVWRGEYSGCSQDSGVHWDVMSRVPEAASGSQALGLPLWPGGVGWEPLTSLPNASQSF